jgi:hypothetical protein
VTRVQPDQILFLALLVAIPLGMIAAGVWFVAWYAQRKIQRDLANERGGKR